MSYLQFLLWFLLPPLALVAVVAVVRLRRVPDRPLVRRLFAALAVYVGLAVVWTAPWDSYLIMNGVWHHGEVWGRFMLVPAEEYAFMVGQAVLTGLWTALLVTARPAPVRAGTGFNRRFGTAYGWIATAVTAWVLHPLWTEGFYLTAIVGWFAPLFALQSAVGADRLAVAGARLRLLAVGVPTVYLWVADRVAIAAGTWTINPGLTTPVRPFGLPLEEAVFFLVTNLVLVNGIVLSADWTMWDRASVGRSLLGWKGASRA